jgi:hypothetical protein
VFISDLCIKVFTDEVPFQTVPESALISLISKEHKRLSRPTSEDAAGRTLTLFTLKNKDRKRLSQSTSGGPASRGLTSDMWELLWKCSDPTPARRPQFSKIATTIADLVKHQQPVSSKKSHGGCY